MSGKTKGVETTRKTVIRAAAISGLVGPILFSGTLAALSVLQYDFMIGIGWRPIRDPAGAWPSGLALGPYGWAQDASFAISGALLAIFALGLRQGTGERSRVGTVLLFVAGAAMTFMAFATDPIRRTSSRTLHGWVHDAAFAVFVLALVLALFCLWFGMREDPLWRGHARYTLVTATCATFLLFLPGAAYYLFLAVVLVWLELTAMRLWRLPSG
jgi:hypothetical protein